MRPGTTGAWLAAVPACFFAWKENDEKTDESITNKVNPEGKEEILNENTNS